MVEAEKDIVLFYFYSSPSAAANCYLRLSNDIFYRNMFLVKCPDDRIHFEFPMFEDHSYNTICNLKGLRRLIQQPSGREKYIIFRTQGQNIVGFYRVLREYYQEISMFDNNGFVWGVEGDAYLIRKDAVKYDGPRLRQGYRASWHSAEWAGILNGLLDQIRAHENISHIYQSETNRLVALFKDAKRTKEWEEACLACGNQRDCDLYRNFARYDKQHLSSNIFSAISHVYNSNLYSRNVLNTIPKCYLK